MRFSHSKVHELAERIVAMLESDEDATLLAPRAEVEQAVAGAISTDLRAEDEIDEEVEQMLEQYRHQIENEGLDATLLQRKIKHEVARKRGFSL